MAPLRASPLPHPFMPIVPTSAPATAGPPLLETWRDDIPASVVVFLVALPLCLGVALASGAPLLSGVIAGIVGGIAVGAVSGSALMVSGPAAGLTAIVLAGIAQVGGFPRFLPAVILGGLLQIVLSVIRAGVVGYYFPSSVLKGMLAAIGLTLILKQIPHAVGYDADYEGDFAFVSPSGENSFDAIGTALGQVQPGAIAVALLGVALLSLEATNKLDPVKRDASANRELLAQGVGNMLSGFFGGLPVTGVIVRSSANVDAGARSRLSAIVHGGWLIVAVLALAPLLNRIPLAVLASVLLVTGFKLTTPALWKNAWRLGWSHFIPFAVTIIAILLTDLLKGIGVGLVVGIAFIIAEHMRTPVLTKVSPPGAILTRYTLPDQVTFLSKLKLVQLLESLPPGCRVEIDGRKTTRF
ncbi:MAG: SulP family inorganic anion transporter, partial [Gemmatimonadaceae bacterium]|nr:SulP family inorganic anion transporter [Gemmatimonadaceae bacterium]